MGSTETALPATGSLLWDDENVLDVVLLHDGMWLEGRSDAALLAGGNLVLIGNELVQFGRAEALGENRFRLSHFLRGRRGTEAAAQAHAAGERFILIDPALLGSFDPPVSRLGSTLLFRASSTGEDPGGAEPVEVALHGYALLPPSPVHLDVRRLVDGAIAVSWIRRSRQGWGWLDGADAPLAEEAEAYRLRLQFVGGEERTVELSSPTYTYTPADQAADGGYGLNEIDIAVAQISALAGPGMTASGRFTLSS